MSRKQTLASIFDNTSESSAIKTTATAYPKNSELSYGQLKDQLLSFAKQANSLFGSEDGRIPVGTTLSSSIPNTLTCLITFLASTLLRCIAAPLNPAMKQSEVEFYLEDAQSKVLIVPHDVDESNESVKAARKLGVKVWVVDWDESEGGIKLSILENGSPVSKDTTTEGKDITIDDAQPDDIALLLHTSGTTGRPKAVPLTHANLSRSMLNISNTYKLTPQDRTFLVMPLFHVHGLIGAGLSTLYAGGSIALPPKFSASHFWSEYVETQSNWYSAVPTIHQILLLNPLPETRPTIRFIRSCSSALAPSVLHQLEEKLGASVLEAYAMTEASHQMCSNPLGLDKDGKSLSKPGSVGIPQGVEVTILSEDNDNPAKLGEVCIRGPNVTKGYLNNPEANAKSFTQESNWFRTGDQGYFDEDGYLFLTGRIKELINRGGEKISPLELDAVLLKHPDVAEAVSFGVDDEMYGQEVYAAVVPKSGHENNVSEEVIKKFMAEHVAKFKVPKKVYISDSLPRTATGKIQRRIVAKHFAENEQKK
ncbi:hypothetical protein H4219_005086 [Mycoemilia scoparia]|uniref:Peroxisomal-coenzyme A synthetase n=1 Tax=Mycoemilia scoparia TaxID=417184 RepID=A0A9W8DLR1_9FUNG|nr:hypothetical protein H4219_005086 [Mycoemilia scoparia]